MSVSFGEQVALLHEMQQQNARVLIGELGGSIVAAAREYDGRDQFRWNHKTSAEFERRFAETIPVGAFSTSAGVYGPDGSYTERGKWFTLDTYSVTGIVPAEPGTRGCCRGTLHLPVLTEVVEVTHGPNGGEKQYDAYDPYAYGFPAHVGDIVRDYIGELRALRDDGSLPDLDHTMTAITKPDPA